MSQGLRSISIFSQSAKVGCYSVDRASEREPVDRLVGPVVAESQGQADQVVRREPVIPIRVKRLLQENEGWQEIVSLFAVHDPNGNAGDLQAVETGPVGMDAAGVPARRSRRCGLRGLTGPASFGDMSDQRLSPEPRR